MLSSLTSNRAISHVLLLHIFVLNEARAQYSVDGWSAYAADQGYSSLDKDEFNKRLSVSTAQGGPTELNMTGVKGREVVIPCTLITGSDSLVVWMDKMDNVLFFDTERMIDDNRFDLETGEGNLRNLKIRNISILDAGTYRCILNTEPIQIKYYGLIVHEPAVIDRVMSSKSILADEGLNVSLICNASGNPQPKLTWTVHRSDDGPLQSAQDIPGPLEGQVLTIYNIQRNCDDIYTCRASNDIGYGDQHSINVKVRFAPNITLPTTKLYQEIGKSTVLTCIIDAFPLGIMYWSKNGVKLKNSMSMGGNPKFRYAYNETKPWSVIMYLEIEDITANDYGHYKCSVSNAKGQDDKYMELVDRSKLSRVTPWWPFQSSTAAAVATPNLSTTKRTRKTPIHTIEKPHIPIPSPISDANTIGVISTCTILLSSVVLLL